MEKFEKKSSEEMHLPPELQQLVHDYARPLFKYRNVFNDAKIVLDQRHWEPIRHALNGPNAGQISEILKTYTSQDLQKFCGLHLFACKRPNTEMIMSLELWRPHEYTDNDDKARITWLGGWVSGWMKS